MTLDPPIAFAVPAAEAAPLRIRVNFGIVAGREATPAEIEQLGRELLSILEGASIVSEQRYTVGPAGEATVHQVLVSVPAAARPDDPAVADALERRLVEVAERWARACAADRSVVA